MTIGGESWTQLSSSLAGLMFIITILKPYFPQFILRYLDNLIQKITSYFNNNAQIIFPEYTPGRLNKRSELYLAIELYLSSLATNHAKRLVADMSKKSKKPVLSMDVHEQVIDEFLGVQVEWFSNTTKSNRTSISLYNTEPEEKRFYKLVFPNGHRDTVTASYIQYVMRKAMEISALNRQRKLYTNTSGGYGESWSSVLFEHPASFETLAMDPRKKNEIIDDLKSFSLSKDYYAKIGKAWKRGYLLYGPPGTGKSTMIACIANYLGYDVYDLELTAVKNNIQLRELLIETSSKSIIVIEDVDCSLDLTGRRKNKKDNEEEKELKKSVKGKEDIKKEKSSEVTLSGLLNSIDGLWSGCGSEKIIIFTTNHLEDLDPALIRTGRMDKHIEMSYCGFESFKVLAKNYLDIELHGLFEEVKNLLDEVKMTPADVAEHLMPKCVSDNNVADICLKNLVEALRMAKTEAEAKAGKEEAAAKADGKKVKGVGRLKQKLTKMFKRVKDENHKDKEHVNENCKGKEIMNGGGKEKGGTTAVAVAVAVAA